jgi:hypothetical protein
MPAYTPATILAQLDACAANHCDFPMLDNAYIFPADVRLTLYRDPTRWALALEALGFSPKAGDDADRIILDLYVFGNCLSRPPGLCPTLYPATSAAPIFADPWPGKLLPGAMLALRGREVTLPTDPEAYRAAGITRRSPPAVWGFEALRALLPDYRALLLDVCPDGLVFYSKAEGRVPVDMALLASLGGKNDA